ncbi:MAG: hypothetical protein ACK5LS_01660 [Propioniciclava sp.]
MWISDPEREGLFWRRDATTREGGWTTFELPVPEDVGATVDPSMILIRGDVVSVWGDAQGALAVSTRREDGSFGQPLVVRDEPRRGSSQPGGPTRGSCWWVRRKATRW